MPLRKNLVPLALAALASRASAEYSAANTFDLHAPGFTQSFVTGIVASQQSGYGVASSNGKYRALAWNNFVPLDLTPGNASNTAYALATNGSQQAGWSNIGASLDYAHAVLWNNASSNFVDLNPSVAQSSIIYSVSGNQQAGIIYSLPGGAGPIAYLWTGSAASAVSLHPATYYSSTLSATDGVHQAGYGAGPPTTGENQALFWSGSADSVVLLNPTGFTRSAATGVSGNQQVGYGAGFTPTAGRYHALLWFGSAASFVDLNPTGFLESYANATNGSLQVGYGSHYPDPNTPANRALVWSGTAASAFSLHPFLPLASTDSFADAIDRYGNIAGHYYVDDFSRPVVWYNGNLFTAAVSSTWNNAANWTSGIPAAGTDLLITPPANNLSLNYTQGPAFGKITLDHPTGGSVQLNLSAGILSASSIVIGLVGNAALIQTGGTLLANSLSLGSASGGFGRLSLANPTPFTLSSLVIAHAGPAFFGKLDLASTSLILLSTSANKSSTLSNLRDALLVGSAASWTGNGITSSSVSLDHSGSNSHSTTLALVDNADLHLPSFQGRPLDDNSLIITRTLLGDANLDNIIDALDFDTWFKNVGNHKSTSSSADFDLSGTTDALDFDLWFTHVGLTSLPLSPNPSPLTPPSPIPEPATLSILALATLPLLHPRHNRR